MTTSTEKPNFGRQFSVVATILVAACSLVFAILTRSWSPIYLFAGILVFGNLVGASASTLMDVGIRKTGWDAFTPFHLAVSVSAIAFLIAGGASLVERLTWNGGGTFPSIFVAKEYGDTYSPNKHRLFKMICATKSPKTPIFVREDGDQVLARCGEWYPEVHVISASKIAFARASAETANDPPGMPIEAERD